MERTWPLVYPWARPGNLRLLPPPLSWECMFCPLFPQRELFQGGSLGRVCVAETLWMEHVLSPIKTSINFEILAGGYWDVPVLQLLETNLMCKFPCLSKLPPANLDCLLFLPSLPTLRVRGLVSGFTWEALKVVNQQIVYLINSLLDKVKQIPENWAHLMCSRNSINTYWINELPAQNRKAKKCVCCLILLCLTLSFSCTICSY